MFSFFHLEIGHSVNRKTVSLLAFFGFSALSSCSFFRFIRYLFRSASLSLFLFFSLQLPSYSPHTAPSHFAAALPSRSLCHNTLLLPILWFKIVCFVSLSSTMSAVSYISIISYQLPWVLWIWKNSFISSRKNNDEKFRIRIPNLGKNRSSRGYNKNSFRKIL